MSANSFHIFRFAAKRPPDRRSSDGSAILDLEEGDGMPTPLVRSLRAARDNENGLEEIRRIGADFVSQNGQTDLALRLTDISASFSKVDALLDVPAPSVDSQKLQDEVNSINLTSEVFSSSRQKLTDNLCATLVLGNRYLSASRELDRSLRKLALIEAITAGETFTAPDLAKYLRRPMRLPRGIFPLPKSGKKERAKKEAFDKQQKEFDDAVKRASELEERLLRNKAAISELNALYAKDLEDKATEQSSTQVADGKPPAGSSGFFQRLARWVGGSPAGYLVDGRGSPDRPVLSPRRTAELSANSSSTIKEVYGNNERINVPSAVTSLENDTRRAANSLYTGGALDAVVRLGHGFVKPESRYKGDYGLLFGGLKVPGRCEVLPPDPPSSGSSGIPPSLGRYESLGIIDLMVTKQTLLRYEVGEIAHIENVLKSEKRKRQHRKLDRTETFTSTESEQLMEVEMELETTQRYELQRESEKTIEEESSRNAGVTVSGSYGMSVDFSATAEFASTSGKVESNRLSSSFAKEVTEKATQRIQETVRQRRSRLTIEELEVVNTHSFTNTGNDAENITGIYRWLDKLYLSQVYNYGKREVIELMIPEPAAFTRYVATNAPTQGITVPKPMEPGYCTPSTGKFEPLEPKHLTREKYMFWVSKYNVEDVSPPPPEYQVLGVAISQPPKGGEREVGESNNSLNVPGGYTAKRAWLAKTNVGYGDNVRLTVLIGRHGFNHGEDKALDDETGIVPIAVGGYGVGSFAVNVEVECRITTEAFEKWQIQTFNAIMNKYELLRAEYEDAIAAGEDELPEVSIEGRNPLINREVEQRELKRAAISQMADQDFNGFDSMRQGVPPFGYPEVDIDDAWEEGRYVRFIEQAFEWSNMQYLFYPYFWGRKKDWPLISQIADVDPLYQAFLQAGFARVNVPIRPGFESAANTFLSTGLYPWSDEGAAISENDEELFLSIAEELRTQQGVVFMKSEGRVSLINDGTNKRLAGTGTEFIDDDTDRDITIRGVTYRIRSVDEGNQELELTSEVEDPDLVDELYAIGAKAVEAPWSVVVPTSLVILGQGDDIVGLDESEEGPPPG